MSFWLCKMFLFLKKHIEVLGWNVIFILLKIHHHRQCDIYVHISFNLQTISRIHTPGRVS